MEPPGGSTDPETLHDWPRYEPELVEMARRMGSRPEGLPPARIDGQTGHGRRADGSRRSTTLSLLSRDGDVVAKLAGGGAPVTFSADGEQVIVRRLDGLEAFDRAGKRLWTIPLAGYRSEVTAAPATNALLVWSGSDVSWFSLR